MKRKSSELLGAPLDWAVALAEDIPLDAQAFAERPPRLVWIARDAPRELLLVDWCPSTAWELAGPLIERERMAIVPGRKGWFRADFETTERQCFDADGPTQLVAAMRALVTSRLGDEVEIPAELYALPSKTPQDPA